MGGRPGHAAHIVNDMGIMQECKYVEPALAGTAETYSPKVTIAGIRIWIGTAGYIAEDRYDIQRMLHNMSKEQANISAREFGDEEKGVDSDHAGDVTDGKVSVNFSIHAWKSLSWNSKSLRCAERASAASGNELQNMMKTN